jgi:2-C-methyl-D-erythritol 4-phosphate cytidylyltransferase
MKVAAIIPVAGKGKRFGGDIAKQYYEINGKPIIAITLNKILAVKDIHHIILVVAAHEVEKVSQIIKQFCDSTKKIRIVTGGEKRQDSVYNGLQKIDKDTDIVIVHDGVRPLIQPKTISKSIEIAAEHGACIVAVAVKDTIKKIAGNTVMETIPRAQLVQVQTPQTFKYQILKRAHEKAKKINYYATDESGLVEWLSLPVVILNGHYDNIKITTKDDLKIAEALMRRDDKSHPRF